MTKYKGDSVDYKGGGGGGRRFAILLGFLLMGLMLVYAAVSDTPADEPLPPITATPTAVGAAVSVDVNAAPAVNVQSNVNVEQAPPPAPILQQDNTAALMAADTARDARLAADNALSAVNALSPRVAAIETRTAQLDEVPPTLMRFEQSTADTAANLNTLSVVLVMLLVGLLLLCVAVGWLVMRPPHPAPRGMVIDQRTDENHIEPVAVPLVEPVRTVPERFQNGSTENHRTDSEPLKLDPSVPMTTAERRLILYWFTVLNSYSAVAKFLYGFKNGTTFNRVKTVIREVQPND